MELFCLLPRMAALAAAICSVVPAWAQVDGPIKIGVLEDMSTLYSDITGVGSVAAAELAIEDFYTNGAALHEDGLALRDMHLFRVKSPEQSTGEWDLYQLINTVRGEDAFWPRSESRCALVTGG